MEEEEEEDLFCRHPRLQEKRHSVSYWKMRSLDNWAGNHLGQTSSAPASNVTIAWISQYSYSE